MSSNEAGGAVDGLALKNVLANSPSPYLRAHKDNPVAWQEWSSDVISLAKQHERMIFLSIGYSACHWCHVMEKESFSSPEVASILNDSFIPIKLDRESRPDLDDIYMNYVTATTGSGGWPLNVFVTPDLQPVFGGTYWPGPSSEINLQVQPGEDRPLTFLDILHKMKDIWNTDREKCIQSAIGITNQLQAFAAEGIHTHASVHVKGLDEPDIPEPLELDLLDDALDHFVTRYDAKYGGFSNGLHAPKFPTPTNLTFLLRVGASIMRPSTHTRFGFPSPVPGILGKRSCATAASMAIHTLISMSRSGIRDHLGHGFHRYSVTPDWNLPHFEKMLCDNAQILAAYCDAWALGRDPEILGSIYDLVEYFTNPSSPIVRPGGGWYSSEDADSKPHLNGGVGVDEQKKEGAFYVWTEKELASALDEREAPIIARHFGVKPDGNVPAQFDVHDEFISQNVLHIDATPSTLAKEFGLKEEEVVKIIKSGRAKLADYRDKQRARPEVDTKIITAWNGLAIWALARAATTLSSFDDRRAKLCRESARKAVQFVQTTLFNSSNGKLTRILSVDGTVPEETKDLAFVDDYAYMIQGLIKLYDGTFDQTYLDFALQLQSTLDRDFYSEHAGGYFQSAKTPLTQAYNIIPTSPTSERPSSDKQKPTKMPDQILNLKPGTDNSLPSANGTIASNLLYLSAYTSALGSIDSSSTTSSISSPEILHEQAGHTINAFSPEIIQHPFLYVSLLSAIVMDTVGVTSLVVSNSMSESDMEAQGLRGFGRTVVRVAKTSNETDATANTEVLICDLKTKTCRPLKAGELDDPTDDPFSDDNEEELVPMASSSSNTEQNNVNKIEAGNAQVENRNGGGNEIRKLSSATAKEDERIQQLKTNEAIARRQREAMEEDELIRRRESLAGTSTSA